MVVLWLLPGFDGPFFAYELQGQAAGLGLRFLDLLLFFLLDAFTKGLRDLTMGKPMGKL